VRVRMKRAVGMGFGEGAGWAPPEQCRWGLEDLARHATQRNVNYRVLS